MDDCKVLSFKTSKKTIISDVFTLKVRNFFILPEYDKSFEINSPCFKFANAAWCFQFRSIQRRWIEDCDRKFGVYMKSINSEMPLRSIFYRTTLLDANDKKYADSCGKCRFKEDGCTYPILIFDDENDFDRRDTLTLIIHLIWRELIEQDTYEAPQIQVLHDKMADDGKHCKISLKLSNKSISSDVYTWKLSNLFTAQEHDGTTVEINSPTFEFANETWCFQFQLKLFQFDNEEEFNVYILKLKSTENNVKTNLNVKKKFWFLFTFLDKHDRKQGDFLSVCNFGKDVEKAELYSLYHDSPDTFDTLTLIFHIFPLELIDVDEDNMPRTINRDVDLLTQDLKELFMNSKNYDLTLRVAEKDFLVHRVILTARSPVFEAMLSHDMIEKNSGVIDVPDCDPLVMEQLLFYVYSGKVEILNQDNAVGLYYASDKYNMMFLKDQCSEFLKKSLSSSVICDVIQVALNHNDTDLLECATEYFVNHISEILPTVEWMSFMKLNSIAANELLIKATKKWDCGKL